MFSYFHTVFLFSAEDHHVKKTLTELVNNLLLIQMYFILNKQMQFIYLSVLPVFLQVRHLNMSSHSKVCLFSVSALVLRPHAGLHRLLR